MTILYTNLIFLIYFLNITSIAKKINPSSEINKINYTNEYLTQKEAIDIAIRNGQPFSMLIKQGDFL